MSANDNGGLTSSLTNLGAPAPLSFELVTPLPMHFPQDWPVGTVSALRVIIGWGGKLWRKGLLHEWRVGDPNFGPAIAEKYVEALCDAGFLEPRFSI